PDLGQDTERALGGESGALLLERVKASPTVDYEAVRTLKRQALRFAFLRFREHDLATSSTRARAFHEFCGQSRAWLEDYALFRALKDAHGGLAFWAWGDALRRRDPAVMAEAEAHFRDSMLYHAYLQWLAHAQWYEARARLAAMGVEVMGDLPFMVGRD